jgi:hypothetical protein
MFAVVIVNHGRRRLLGEKVVTSVAAPEMVLPRDELVQIVIPVLASATHAVSQVHARVLFSLICRAHLVGGHEVVLQGVAQAPKRLVVFIICTPGAVWSCQMSCAAA